MALIKCPECGQMISDKSVACIHCGYPLQQPQQTIPKKLINVHIHRKGKFVGSAITNIVSVDGVQMGSVNNGGSCDFSIAPGLHNITIGKGATGSVWTTVADATRQINWILYRNNIYRATINEVLYEKNIVIYIFIIHFDFIKLFINK